MKRYYYSDRFKTDGNVLGPVSIEELEQLYIKQEITEYCLVCIEGAEKWEHYLKVLKQYIDHKKYKKKKGNKLLEYIFNGVAFSISTAIVAFSAYWILVGGYKIFEVIFFDDDSPKIEQKQNWDNSNIIAVEKEVTESRLKPSIGVIGGRKPRTGIVGTYERGSTKYKVTYEDDNGIIRTETLNKDPTKD